MVVSTVPEDDISVRELFIRYTPGRPIWKLEQVVLLDYKGKLILNTIDAESASDLLQKLWKTDISVPARIKGRTTKQCETWVIYHFLATICRTALVGYPLRIRHRDRPDFVFVMPFMQIGVEIVEAVPQAQAEADAYSEHKAILAITGIPHFEPGEPQRSQKEIKAIAKGTYRVLPWMDDSIEQSWIRAMLYFSRLKASKFQKPGFKKYDNNWLLVYDDWRPSSVDERMVTEGFSKQLFNQNWVNPFERIFVLRPEAVWEFSNQAKPVTYPVLDLWHEVQS